MKIGDIYRETKYLVFTVASKKPKTLVLHVRNKDDHFIGRIAWLPAWRQYVFHSEVGIIFNHQCLKDIACVLDDFNDLHKKGYDV